MNNLDAGKLASVEESGMSVRVFVGKLLVMSDNYSCGHGFYRDVRDRVRREMKEYAEELNSLAEAWAEKRVKEAVEKHLEYLSE